ncbi:MAG: hypothetical protein KC431_27255, partial [Myxococcales bacterium]|nr:hypothetical protein [Myxococcales bacterium]
PAEKSWVDSDEGANVTQRNDGTREYVIDDGDDITGQKLTPGGADVQGRRGREHANMITIRPHFMAEMESLSMDI